MELLSTILSRGKRKVFIRLICPVVRKAFAQKQWMDVSLLTCLMSILEMLANIYIIFNLMIIKVYFILWGATSICICSTLCKWPQQINLTRHNKDTGLHICGKRNENCRCNKKYSAKLDWVIFNALKRLSEERRHQTEQMLRKFNHFQSSYVSPKTFL